MREAGVRSAVGAPIVVEGRLWGVIIAASRQDEPLPAGTESRVEEFTELVATAISNVQAWSDLAASRGRIVAAADEERRRVVRDLHDGAQQRLVHTVLTLKLARRALEQGTDDAPGLVTDAINHAEQANTELRELVAGHPATGPHARRPPRRPSTRWQRGCPCRSTSTSRSAGCPLPIEATAYFVVAEALTNVAKHARARSAAVGASIESDTLRVEVRDDGLGGARPGGSGLVGLRDRLAVLEGQLRVESPADGGTLVAADIPLPDQPLTTAY